MYCFEACHFGVRAKLRVYLWHVIISRLNVIEVPRRGKGHELIVKRAFILRGGSGVYISAAGSGDWGQAVAWLMSDFYFLPGKRHQRNQSLVSCCDVVQGLPIVVAQWQASEINEIHPAKIPGSVDQLVTQMAATEPRQQPPSLSCTSQNQTHIPSPVRRCLPLGAPEDGCGVSSGPLA